MCVCVRVCAHRQSAELWAIDVSGWVCAFRNVFVLNLLSLSFMHMIAPIICKTAVQCSDHYERVLVQCLAVLSLVSWTWLFVSTAVFFFWLLVCWLVTRNLAGVKSVCLSMCVWFVCVCVCVCVCDLCVRVCDLCVCVCVLFYAIFPRKLSLSAARLQSWLA